MAGMISLAILTQRATRYRLFLASFSVVALRASAAAVTFLLSVTLARSLGPDGLGIYQISYTLATVASVVGTLGMGHALLRFMSVHAAADRWHQIHALHRRAVRLGLGTGAAAAILLAALAPWLAHGLFDTPDLERPLQIMALGAVAMTLFTLHAEALKALRRPAGATAASALAPPALALSLFLTIGRPWGVLGAAASWAAAAWLTLLFAAAVWWRSAALPPGQPGYPATSPRDASPAPGADALLRTSLPLLVIALAAFALDWMDLVILAVWVDADWIGRYGAALRLATLISLILVSVQTVIAPDFAQLHATGDRVRLELAARRSALLGLLIAMPILLVFFLVPGFVMGLFGDEFRIAAPLLVILVVGHAFSVATGSVGLLLVLTGHEHDMQRNILAVALAKLLVAAVLVARFGPLGGAVANLLGIVTLNVVSTILVYRRLRIVPIPIPGWRRAGASS